MTAITEAREASRSPSVTVVAEGAARCTESKAVAKPVLSTVVVLVRCVAGHTHVSTELE